MNWHNVAVMWCMVAGIVAFFALYAGVIAVTEERHQAALRIRAIFLASLLTGLALGSLLAGGLV